jgi:peptide/nickel transport system permease protein
VITARRWAAWLDHDRTRRLQAALLDELDKPDVTTARAKDISKIRMLVKDPIRLGLDPFVSTDGWVRPSLISGVRLHD